MWCFIEDQTIFFSIQCIVSVSASVILFYPLQIKAGGHMQTDREIGRQKDMKPNRPLDRQTDRQQKNFSNDLIKLLPVTILNNFDFIN